MLSLQKIIFRSWGLNKTTSWSDLLSLSFERGDLTQSGVRSRRKVARRGVDSPELRTCATDNRMKGKTGSGSRQPVK